MFVCNLNSPLKSETVPYFEFTILTDAPIKSSPVSSSVIFPFIKVWEIKNGATPKNKNRNEKYL